MVAPGEIRFVWFPFSRGEAEPYKKRPVLVLGLVGTVPDRAVLVTMVTANPQRMIRPHAGDVPLPDWEAIGLAKPSVVRTRRIWTAEERDFTGALIGTVDQATLDAVKAELSALLK